MTCCMLSWRCVVCSQAHQLQALHQGCPRLPQCSQVGDSCSWIPVHSCWHVGVLCLIVSL